MSSKSKPTIIPFANPEAAFRDGYRNAQSNPYGGMTDEEALRRMRSPEFVTALAEASEGISPDPIGCETFFLTGFITEEMAMEFPIIARDFLSHVYSEIPSFWMDIYGSDSPREGYTFSFLNQKILNMMFLAAKGSTVEDENKGIEGEGKIVVSGDTEDCDANERNGSHARCDVQSYAIDLFRNLYRSYHRKEYLALKRYSSITVADVFTIAVMVEPSYNDFAPLVSAEAREQMIAHEREEIEGIIQMAAYARIMVMAGFLGITLKPECKYLYKILFDTYQELEEADRKGSRLFTEGAEDDLTYEQQLSIQERRIRNEAKKLGAVSLPEGYRIPEEIMEQSRTQVKEWWQECLDGVKPDSYGMVNPLNSRKMSPYLDGNSFVGDVLNYYGYDREYVIRSDYHYKGLEKELVKTLALLNWRKPGREHSFEEVQLYSLLMRGARALVGQMDRADEYLDCMFGIDDRYYEWDDSSRMFKPENTGSVKTVNDDKVQTTVVFEEKKAAVPQAVDTEAAKRKQRGKEDKSLMAEIDRLREKTHRQEKEIQKLYSMYSDAKEKVADYRERQENYEDDLKELQALREHVYKYTEEDEEVVPDVECMEKAIAEKKVVIIGGRDSWTNRLKSRFVEWRFISTDVSGIIDLRIFDGTDYTYFFTDYLSHSTYTGYVKALRERGLPFGYIHSTNVEKNIMQIFEDTCK